MRVLTIDPGKHDFGWSLFGAGDTGLLGCGLVRSKTRYELVNKTTQLVESIRERLTFAVIEIPQVYQQRHWRGDPNDLIQVALTAGGVGFHIIDLGLNVKFVLPHDWKGSRKKEICNPLTLRTLNPKETKIFKAVKAPKYLQHNVLDAIGIGLWTKGRR